jgi:HAD superfamily hydrolase (TIGR01450 family)
MTIHAEGMKEFSSRFPIWFCDVWGVIHNGYEAFGEATRALTSHRAQGGIVTSGDVTQDLLRRHAHGKVFLIGPARDLSILDGLGIAQVPLAETKTVLCTGLFDDETETPEDYADHLAELKAHQAVMICANPDKVVRKGQRLLYCAGALAEAYGKLGGEVLMAGKPFAPIYELAMGTATRIARRELAKADVLAIGDGPETDIRGAADFGIACVLVADGVTDRASGLDAATAATLAAVPHARLMATVDALAWD